jgi:protein-L-isoaspartate(D-aspartate) O-methyltransferase
MQSIADMGALLKKRNQVDLYFARKCMVDRLARDGIGRNVIAAMNEVPRHAFVPTQFEKLVYTDNDIWINNTVIMAPKTTAIAAHFLDLHDDEKVLEIGTGTGYQSTVLALLSGQVCTIELALSCANESSEAFSALGLSNLFQKRGDGGAGWSERGPFDAIIVDASTMNIPRTLIGQLKPESGRMIIPVGPYYGPQRLLLVKQQHSEPHITDLGSVSFPPLTTAAWEVGPTAEERFSYGYGSSL